MAATKIAQFAKTGGLNDNAGDVKEAVKLYEEYHKSGWSNKGQQLSYMDMVNKYYDLATSFYEFGWGESFHFAHRCGRMAQRCVRQLQPVLYCPGAVLPAQGLNNPDILCTLPIVGNALCVVRPGSMAGDCLTECWNYAG